MSDDRIDALLRDTIGLDVATVGAAAIDRAVKVRMTARHLSDRAAYLDLLDVSNEERQELTEAVVVPETSFFRHAESFLALGRFAVDEWLPAHSIQTMRLLSFPCSTGEEPYSMAMALLEGGVGADRFRIDAFDISRHALDRAKRAHYRRNSFRGSDLSFRDRYFIHDRRGYALIDEIRSHVSFELRNVVEDATAPKETRYDVIFCRNLLIYFDPSTQQRALRNLDAMLAADGMFFAGPAESFQVSASGFRPTSHQGAFAFRKPGSPAATPLPARVDARPRGVSAPRGRPIAKSRPRRSPEVPVAAAAAPVRDDLELARSLADAGNLAAALEVIERNLREPRPSAEAYYVRGLIRDAMSDFRLAIESYRKALYLDPDHVEALLHLALLVERGGDAVEAQRFRDRARRIEERTRS